MSKLTHYAITKKRLCLACGVGGISSMLVILSGTPFIHGLILTLLKILSMMLIMFIAFNLDSKVRYIKYCFLYILINIIFAGATILVWEISGSRIIYFKNFTVYFDISIFKLIIATIVTYISISIYEYIIRKNMSITETYHAVFSFGNYECKLPAIADTGNKLTDIFTGSPVVIFCCDELYHHFNLDDENQLSDAGFHCIPFATVSGEGLIKVTAKGNVKIIDSSNNEKNCKCCVGILGSGEKSSKAIFNPNLII